MVRRLSRKAEGRPAISTRCLGLLTVGAYPATLDADLQRALLTKENIGEAGPLALGVEAVNLVHMQAVHAAATARQGVHIVVCPEQWEEEWSADGEGGWVSELPVCERTLIKKHILEAELVIHQERCCAKTEGVEGKEGQPGVE